MNTVNTKTRPGISKLAGRIAALLAALALAAFTLAEMRLTAPAAADLAAGRISFAEFTSQVHDKCVSGTPLKYTFVDLNGLYCKLTGRNICNQIMRLKNGMLTNYNPERHDMTAPAEGIAALADYAAQNGAQLIYVQCPSKLDAESQLLIPGEEDHSNENADELLSLLSAAGVETLDLRKDLAQTPQQIEQYFFRTDHHWNFTGAFAGYQRLMQTLYARFPDAGIDMACADSANWEAHTLHDWMLGSQGKRTGVFFGGTDDITYYTPRFDTQMSCEIPVYSGGSAYYEGSFADVNIRGEYLAARPDRFESSPYDMYIGGEYALVRHRSESASSDLKLLLVKDSFALPVEAFLSTAFKSIDVLDPRYMEDETVAGHIRDEAPDVVIVMLSQNSAWAYPEYSDYGIPALSE